MIRKILFLILFMMSLHANAERVISCVPYADLEFPQMMDFLKSVIFPIYKSHHGNKDYDRIYVTLGEYDSANNPTAALVTVYMNDESELDEPIFASDINNYYAMFVDGVRVIIEASADSRYINKKRGHAICFQADTLIGTNDNCCSWFFDIKEDKLIYRGIYDWGLRWLKDTPMEKYMPGFRPIKRIESSTRIELIGNLKVSPPEYIYP